MATSLNYVHEFRDPAAARALSQRIKDRVESLPADRLPVTIMEVCGTHTVSIFRHGIRQLLPSGLRLLSGPGCPVCVTPNREIDEAIALAERPEVTLATFGDMMRVPGSTRSLQQARAAGADVRVVYSPLDAVKIARQMPDRQVVFFAVGFETTAPAVAGAIYEADRQKVENLSFVVSHKVIPPAMSLLLASEETRIDGFLCPGHVSVIIGARPYEFIARDYHTPCVIAGFEPLDILLSIDMLLAQITAGEAKVEIQYRRSVHWEGNEHAVRMLDDIFEPDDVPWRGIGVIPGSGWRLKPRYAHLDARKRFSFEPEQTREHAGCLCGAVLRGAVEPPECKLFGTVCTPERPIGPCMVSTEGTCAAWYHYSGVA